MTKVIPVSSKGVYVWIHSGLQLRVKVWCSGNVIRTKDEEIPSSLLTTSCLMRTAKVWGRMGSKSTCLISMLAGSANAEPSSSSPQTRQSLSGLFLWWNKIIWQEANFYKFKVTTFSQVGVEQRFLQTRRPLLSHTVIRWLMVLDHGDGVSRLTLNPC